MQLVIVYLVADIKKRFFQKIFIYLYIFTFFLATIFWILDQKVCSTEDYFPYHALWHFFTALAIFYGYLSFIV